MGEEVDDQAAFRAWLIERGLEAYYEEAGGMSRLLLYEAFCEEEGE